MSELKALSIPEGLEGERVDAAMARMLGLSRTRAVELVTSGAVTLDHRPVAKSDRVSAGQWLEVDIPAQIDRTPQVKPQKIDNLRIIHDDSEIVPVDVPDDPLCAHRGEPAPATASPPPERPSDRASSSVWTSARPG